ncbi:MAG: hypothetical protein CMQ61_14215 [Gammaproteobacteria bacterium]|nr:hypothetical protein [Gammaproteobacteria bacterium]
MRHHNEDWSQFEPFMLAALKRMPALAQAGIQHFMSGAESFTPDAKPLLGDSSYLQGFFVAAGLNSTGMMSSPGVGEAMSYWLTQGYAPFDMLDVDIARCDRAAAGAAHLEGRIPAAVGDVFNLHWPF